MKNIIIRGPRSDWRDLPVSKSLFNQPKGRGIVIGNLTSQLLSNIFLDQLARETVGRRMIMESYELLIQYLEYARVDNPNPNANLAKMIELTRRLRDGMAYVNRLQLMHHREICQVLENLVLIDRITSKTYSKAIQATKR